MRIHGAEMLVFAVIFSLWKKDRAPVLVSYRRIRDVTGLSRSTIAKALSSLRWSGYISIGRCLGKPSRFTVRLGASFRFESLVSDRKRIIDPSGIQLGTRPIHSCLPVRKVVSLIKE